ncbi:MAG: hypothetical protein WCP35_05310 [Verrucomicrobiota bacterium]
MKLTKSLVATISMLAMGATANATETIYITGSSAFRAGALNAIKALLGGVAPNAQSNATFTSSNACNWMGVTYNGHTINVKVCFYGSTGGIQTVSESVAWPFLIDGATGTISETFVPGSTSMTSYHDFHVPNIAMGDSYQSTTPFTTTLLNDITVGVVPFQFVASYGAPTGQSMNNHLFNAIFSGGSCTLKQMTGSAADSAKSLFALGRDADSGTRTIALCETGYGANTAVAQYKPVVSGTSVTSHAFYPSSTINGIFYDLGNTGYPSGGTVAGMLRNETLTNLNGYYVSYLGKSDANTALNGSGGAGNAVALAWNGVNYYTGGGVFNDAAITSGQYTFWSYEHVLYPNQVVGSQAEIFAPALGAAIKGTDASNGTIGTAGISSYSMSVTRSGDGTYVTY